MTGRYMIIEFDDEAQADTLRARIDKATREGKKFRVVGLFAKPMKYCQCDPRTHVTHDRKHQSTLKRGKKYGWWVCTACKLPAPSLTNLVNMLKPRDIIKPRRFRRLMDWKGGPGFIAQHYIWMLSASSEGPKGVEYWNSRGPLGGASQGPKQGTSNI